MPVDLQIVIFPLILSLQSAVGTAEAPLQPVGSWGRCGTAVVCCF